MRKLLRITAWTAASCVALGVFALLSANLYLQSSGVRTRLERELEKRLGVEVRFGTLSYLPFRGIRLSDLAVGQRHDVRDRTSAPFFHADYLRFEIDLASVFGRPLVVREVLCERPAFTLIQDRYGAVALPWQPLPESGATPLPEPAVAPEEIAATSPPPVRADADRDEKARSEENGAPVVGTPVLAGPLPATTLPSLSGVASDALALGWLRARKGSLRLLSPTGQGAVIALEGIAVDLDTQVKREGQPLPKGKLSVESAKGFGVFRASNLEGTLTASGHLVALSDLEGVADGGVIKGLVMISPELAGVPYQVRIGFTDVSLNALAGRTDSRLEFSSGALAGQVAAAGYLGAVQSWRGAGRVEAVGARVAKSALLEAFGRYLGLQEFVEMVVEKATIDFRLEGPRLAVDDVHFKTENLEFKALGGVSIRQELDLAARLYVSRRMKEVLQRIERQLPERVTRKFGQLEGRDDFFRDFLIGGTIAEPHTNFLGNKERSFEEMMTLMRERGEDKPADADPEP